MVEARANAPRPVPRDSLRETLDTIVTVVVVVLLLRTYVAEAFMIPTGSMATTLYGYQKNVVCPECKFEFPVNCSSEREPHEGQLLPVVGCACPNCRVEIGLNPRDSFPCSSGDRVLVAKYIYDWTTPNRMDVVVFKNPKSPQVGYDPLNYIKRLVGLPGETIGIHGGDLYVSTDVTYKDAPQPPDLLTQWNKEYMYSPFNQEAQEMFAAGKFQILRKTPDKILSMRRPVYDNDHPAADLEALKFPPRWAPEAEPSSDVPRDHVALRKDAGDAWAADGNHAFRHPARSGSLAWLWYRHLVVPREPKDPALAERTEIRPRLITDFLGYNSSRTPAPERPAPENWVGDLLLESQVTIEKPEGQLVVELAKGPDRFQARWELASGDCSLVRIVEGKDEVLATRPTALKAVGTYRLRVANFDERLTVWVDSALPFGNGVDYPAPKQRGPLAGDLRPVGIGAAGAALKVEHLFVWRDTYYTGRPGEQDHSGSIADWADPDRWTALRDLPVLTYYVQPGHYFCLGDNSPRSSDSRDWGLVPQRLMLGRALLVYFPVGRAGRIR